MPRRSREAAKAGEAAKVYEVQFSRLGENMLKVQYGEGQWAALEFFVTEPLETVIKKRAAFLVSHHQHKDPGKWSWASTATGIRRTRYCEAQKIAMGCPPG